MPNYQRSRIAGGTFFFTVNLADRQQALLTAHIEALKTAIANTRRILPFRTEALVVLPEHLHCIWRLPAGDADYSSRWQLIKNSFSRRVLGRIAGAGSRTSRRERGIWQRRFWEHAIRDDDDYAAHLDYIHYNPVKHGYVKSAAAWPYSTFGRFVASGVYPTNWAAQTELAGNMGER